MGALHRTVEPFLHLRDACLQARPSVVVAPQRPQLRTTMSPRTLSTDKPTRSSTEWEKRDPATLKDSPSQKSDPCSHTLAYAEEDLFEDGAVDAVYQAKARVLNAAVREVGMGKYQVRCSFTTTRFQGADFE